MTHVMYNSSRTVWKQDDVINRGYEIKSIDEA